MKKKILIVHETGGRKYFEVISHLSQAGEIGETDFFESQVTRLFLSSVLRHRKTFQAAAKQALRNMRFRLSVPFVRDHIIILAMAPWDARLVWYRYLAARNTVIYHTSWAQWENSKVPRRYGILDLFLRRIWKKFFHHPNVSIVAVTPASAGAVGARSGKPVTVVPHVISSEFFAPPSPEGQRYFGLLFVGQLIPQKGISLLPDILSRCQAGTVLGIVGDGPMRDEVIEMAERDENIRYYGGIDRRDELANIVSHYNVLLVPSLRTTRWEELFGMVILEAMAAGLVVIASDHIGPRTILTDGEDGFLAREGDTDQIARLATNLNINRQLWQSVSDRARNTARNYSLEAIGRKWLRLLADLAIQKNEPASSDSERLQEEHI